VNVNECSTERVRQYRQRQREARRKLVRFYLDAETSAKLEQLASGQPHAAFAEALLTTAIAQAWSAREAQQQDENELEGNCPGKHEPAGADAARLAQFPGRRRHAAV
jgi:hypothetical protein